MHCISKTTSMEKWGEKALFPVTFELVIVISFKILEDNVCQSEKMLTMGMFFCVSVFLTGMIYTYVKATVSVVMVMDSHVWIQDTSPHLCRVP